MILKNNYNENISIIESYLQNGSKFNSKQSFGVEIEHFILHNDGFSVVNYYEKYGQKYILNEYFERFSGSMVSNNLVFSKMILDGQLIGVDCIDYTLTIEPAGQLEISIRKSFDIDEIEKIYEKFLENIRSILSEKNLVMVNAGYMPKGSIDDVPLIPKKRYEYMFEYFSKTGNSGHNMMKGTASFQVSVDFSDNDDFRRKYQAGIKISPLIKMYSANSHFFEGKRNFDYLLRNNIWKNTDEERCGYPKKTFDRSFSLRDYAEYVYNQTLIYYPKDENIALKNVQVKEYFRDKILTQDDVEFLLSMVFPEIRVKKYIEIRSADSISFKFAKLILLFIKGVIYNPKALDYLEKEVDITIEELESANVNVSQNGWNSKIYKGIGIRDFSDKMLGIATSALAKNEVQLLEQLKNNYH